MSISKQKLKPITSQLDRSEAKWFAVYTRYKSEKFVLDKLNKKGITAYVPLLHFTRKYIRKVKQVELPLINCYVFVKITTEEYVKVLQTEHVIGFLKLSNVLQAIPQREIDILKWVVGEKTEVNIVEGNKMIKGKTVEVVAGKLTGLKGVILNRKNKKFLRVALNTIGFTLEVDISQELLQLTSPLKAVS